MRTIGVDEARFMREASAAFKQGIRFVDWKTAPKDGVHEHYYHPFAQPRLLNGGLNLAPYWLMGGAGRILFSDAVTLQDKVCDAMRGPGRLDDPQTADRWPTPTTSTRQAGGPAARRGQGHGRQARAGQRAARSTRPMTARSPR